MVGKRMGGGEPGALLSCMHLPGRRVLAILAATAVLSAVQPTAMAQSLPDPIRVIVPVAAGSSLDARARVVADALGKRLQRRVIVENRTGAGGVVGTLFVARAKPDGATLLFTNSAHAISAHMQRDPGYDPVRDFTPIASVYESGMVLVAHPDLRVSTVKELIALGKVRGDALNYGSSGPGSLPHLGMEVFKRATGMTFAHVPYKGDSQALADVLPGRIPLMFSGYPASAPSVEAGALKALAVTSPARASVFPNVPTMAELGYPDATVNVWTGFFAPARMPQALVDLLHREVGAAVATAPVQEHFAATGARSMTLSPAAFGAFVAQESARYAKLVTELKLKEE